MPTFGTTLLVTGPEPLLASRIVEERRKQALVEQPGADVNRIDAAELEGSMLAEVVGGSLFSSHIVAIIDDLGSLPAQVVDQVVALAMDPGDELCLTLVHEGGNKGRGVVDKLRKAKVPVETVAALKGRDLQSFVGNEARRHRVRIDGEATEALIAAVGTNLHALAAAVSQLVDDGGRDIIDVTLIQQYFAGRAEVSGFQVVDAVLAGRAALAVERLRWSFETGLSPVALTSAMASGFRGMAKFLDAQGQRLGETEMAAQTGIMRFKLRDYSNWSRGWRQAEVAQAIRLIATADAGVKGAVTDAEFAMERLLLDLLALRRS